MKYLFAVVLILLVGTDINYSQFSIKQSTKDLDYLLITDKQLDSLIMSVISENIKSNTTSEIMLLSVNKGDKGQSIKIAFSRMRYFLNNYYPFLSEDMKIVGSTEKNGMTVFLFGDSLHGLFSKTSQKRHYDFIFKLPKHKKAKTKDIVAPPINFEPDVYRYEYINGKITFIECGKFSFY